MKRNTYVTAALFVVFGLLTVIYMNMPDRGAADYDDALTGALTSVHPDDVATIGGVTAVECALDEDADCEEAEENTAETMGEGETDEAVNDEAADQECCGVLTSLDSLRSIMEEERVLEVAALTEIMASADFSAETKSAAKDSLNDLNALAHSSRVLEVMIGQRGFEDVLVRAGADFVRVTVQVASLADVPTREELAELYIMAGIQFGGHRNGNISIDFQPLN